jgi:hypothetical protein
MGRRLGGNGDSKVNIVVQKQGEGYVIITPDRIDKLPEQTPIFISRSLEAWQKENPTYRVRCVAPIVSEGQTLALHIWFDEE